VSGQSERFDDETRNTTDSKRERKQNQKKSQSTD
jgi:hypothetical protein